jgi:AcrR family transcriptional regulator
MPRLEAVNKQRRAEQHANILNAARVVFSRQGPAATIDDIATQAKVSHGLAYRYFPNKDSLFQALVEEAMQVAPTGLQYFEQLSGHAEDRLTLLISRMIESRRERPEFYLLLDHVRNSPATPKTLRNQIKRQKEAFLALLRSLIVEAQERGTVPSDNPDSLVMAVSAFLEGLGSIALHEPEDFKRWCPAPDILLRIVMPQAGRRVRSVKR